MTILSTRPIVVFALAVFHLGCAGTQFVEVQEHAEVAPKAAVAFSIVVPVEHRSQARRIAIGAAAALRTMAPWVGPYSEPSLRLVEAASERRPDGMTSRDVVITRIPWWSTPGAMAPELAAARGVARRSWMEAVDARALPRWLMDGLIEYTARRAVAPLFQRTNLWPGYAMFEQRFFGGFVPRFVRIRLLPESDGDPLPAYRRMPRVEPAGPRSPGELQSLTAKTVLTLNTLERWLSGPALDGAIGAFVRRSRGTQPSLADFSQALSAATGQDLSWLLDQSFGSTAVFDYAVTELETKSAGDRFETTVGVSRLGDGTFTGTSEAPVGPFESGRGVTLAVAFADSTRFVDHWDGRDARKVFVYESAAPAVSATVDPDRVVLLDVNQTNNSRALVPARGGPTSWALKWMLWLENALLTYAAFV